MSSLNLISALGCVVLCLVAWAAGGFRRPVPWRTVVGSVAAIALMAGLVFLVPPIRAVLLVLNDVVLLMLSASQEGATFLFGPLALPPGETTAAGEPSVGIVLAAQVFPAVIFFSALMAWLHHIGWIEPVVRCFARLFHRTLELSGAESLTGAVHMFFGVETAATIRPYLRRMTSSELLTVLTTNLATAASTTLAIYTLFLQDAFPTIAGHLISASLLSIPCAVLVTKLMLPELDEPETLGGVPKMDRNRTYDNAMAALAGGAMDGVRIAAAIAAVLIAVLGLVALTDQVLVRLTSLVSSSAEPYSVASLLGVAFAPFAWLLGLPAADLEVASRLLGQRLVLTEVVSYQELGALAVDGSLDPRTTLVLSYALCGFAHVSGMGIALGGFGALAPDRMGDLARLSLRALLAATLATLLTGAVAGMFYFGQRGLLGL